MLSRPTVAEIDLRVIQNNLKHLKELAGDLWFCPMLKANAYGHGDIEVAKLAVKTGVDALGVATLEEGIHLREKGILNTEILVFGFLAWPALDIYRQNRLTPVIGSEGDLQKILTRKENKIPIHLKFNTGMNRMGLPASEATAIAKKLAHAKFIELKGICSHLLKADDFGEKNSITLKQIEKFAAVSTQFPSAPVRHLYNSAAMQKQAHKAHNYGVRPGIAIYNSAMSLISEIKLLHNLQKGDCVSYGCVWQAPKPSTIAVVPIGYADGLSRRLTNSGFALVRGQRVPLVGTVCMDYTMVDVTELVNNGQSPKEGDQVVFWGRQGGASLSAEDQAAKAQTISYELFTSVSPRVPRSYVEG